MLIKVLEVQSRGGKEKEKIKGRKGGKGRGKEGREEKGKEGEGKRKDVKERRQSLNFLDKAGLPSTIPGLITFPIQTLLQILPFLEASCILTFSAPARPGCSYFLFTCYFFQKIILASVE